MLYTHTYRGSYELIASDYLSFVYFDESGENPVQVSPQNSDLPESGNSWAVSFDSEGRIWVGGSRILFRLPDEW